MVIFSKKKITSGQSSWNLILIFLKNNSPHNILSNLCDRLLQQNHELFLLQVLKALGWCSSYSKPMMSLLLLFMLSWKTIKSMMHLLFVLLGNVVVSSYDASFAYASWQSSCSKAVMLLLFILLSGSIAPNYDVLPTSCSKLWCSSY